METSPPSIYEFGDFRMDVAKRLLHRCDGTVLPLTPRVFDTLLYLVEHSGVVLDREALMDAVWPDSVVEENNLTQNISTLRRVLGEGPGSHRFIVTVPGRGYRFVAEVREPEEKTDRLIEAAPVVASAVAPRPAADAPPPLVETRTTVPEPLPSVSAARSTRRLIPLALAAVALALGFFFAWRLWPLENATSRAPEVSPISDKSIAVLPFTNLSGDPENAYFAEGVEDEILTRLSKIAALKVISRSSTQRFKSTSDKVREIAQQLRVVNVLEGSVQKSGASVRVTVRLINAQNGTQLWAESYDRKLTDVFQVETEIAQSVATALAATLTGAEQRALSARPTVNVEAHQAYLKGRYFWNKRTVGGHRQAVEDFSRAIAIAPSYAQAYAGLADALIFLGDHGVLPQKEAVAKGRAALQRALELDETLAEPHASLGLLAMNASLDWIHAEKEFKRALELNSNYATAHQWYGEFLAYMGRFDESIAEMKRASELDPLSLIISTDLGKVYMVARRYDEAIAQYKRALEWDANFAEAQGLLAITYSLKGEHDKAVEEFARIKGLGNNQRYLSWLGYVYGVSGRTDEAKSVLRRLEEMSQQTSISPYSIAMVHAGMGEKNEALDWLEKLLDEDAAGGAITLNVSPVFDSLRTEPRYANLLRRANFAP